MPRQRQLPSGMWKRGDTYYARFRANGRLVRKRLSTDFRAACEMLNELRSRADRADFNLLDNDYPWDTLKKEFEAWADQALRNPEDYRRDIKRFEEHVRVRSVREISQNLVVAYRKWRLDNGKSPRTVNREVGTLSNMLNKAVEWGRIAENPIRSMKPLRHDTLAKERRPLEIGEVESLFDNSPEPLALIWRVFMTTGVRKRELCDMRVGHVDFDRKTITIPASTAKSHKPREIPLDEDVLAILETLCEKAESKDHVFTDENGNPWKRDALLRRFYACCKAAGIDDARPGGSVDIHSLRVTFTTLALDNGANPKAVQGILGHSTLGLTMRVYAKATERAKRDAVSALPFAKSTAPEHVIPVQNAHTVSTTEKPSSQDQAAKGVG